MFKRLSILLAAFSLSFSAHATLVDFTGEDWQTAIGTNVTAATVGNVTLTSSGGYLNFNGGSSEIKGCKAGTSDLACLGDGIGIKQYYNNNDEISRYETLTISFLEAIDVSKIYLLDLFLNDNGVDGRDEVAVVSADGNKTYLKATTDKNGGYFSADYVVGNITSIVLSGYKYCFSDYALAAIDVEVSAVPIPGAAILFGSALLGFFGFKRRRAV